MRVGDGVAVSEFVSRREAVLRALRGAVGVVFADVPGAVPDPWRPDWNFYYLTGIRNEAGAAVLFDPGAPDPQRRCILFLRPRNPEAEAWDGYREGLSASLRQTTGFATVLRTTHLPRMLTDAVRRAGRGACLHPVAIYDAPPAPDLTVLRKVCERAVGVRLEDRSTLLAELRAVKSRAELGMLRRAVQTTVAGFVAATRVIRPGATERLVREALEAGFRQSEASEPAFPSIVGAGLSSTVLHYRGGEEVLEAGDVVLVDAGARAGAYAADVTRTFPISGRFTRRQREVYGVVLRAWQAAVRTVRAGVYLHQVERAARRVVERAGLGDAFIHGIGHSLGLDVHDPMPDGPLRAGMVITIEPGVYLPQERLGIRIEDDVLVTRRGAVLLTGDLPRDVAGVEAMVAHARRGPR